MEPEPLLQESNISLGNTDNMIDHLNESSEYWNIRSKTYSETVEDELEGGTYTKWLNKMVPFLETGRKLKILDVGCGPGFFPVVLGREGHEVTAVDYSPGMLEKAEANCRKYGVSAKFQRMDAQHLEFDDEEFDVVVSRNLVWNLDNPENAYREWLRVLKTGGKLMLFDGNHYLYLYDEDYSAFDPDYQNSDIDGVDISVMENIAKELPLSSQRRPQWDTDHLLEMGVHSVFVSNEGDTLKLNKNGKTIHLPFEFFICAEK